MKIDYNTLSLLTSAFAVAVASYSIYIEGKRSRFTLGIDVFFKLSDYFGSEEMKSKRIRSAQILLKVKNNENISKSEEDIIISGEVIDFFQALGELVRNKIIDKNTAYTNFAYWMLNYLKCFEKYIEPQRVVDPFLWKDAYWLKNQFEILEKRFKRDVVVDSKWFLEYESNLS